MNSHDTLEPFLARSSPHLVSLSVRTYDQALDFHHLSNPISLVASTLENLEVSGISTDGMPSIFNVLNRGSAPNIRALIFKHAHGTSNLHELVRFLNAHSARLRTFRLLWATRPFLHAMIRVGPSNTFDTIGGHLSRLAQTGMDIYLGTSSDNYILISDPAIGQDPL
ncbi:hypothetical protein B0H12DRAFT_1153961 [Mycena haematopus]|nr:hypothetical protein B0H12DRAFT_1153961 [Mycena haematopus]